MSSRLPIGVGTTIRGKARSLRRAEQILPRGRVAGEGSSTEDAGFSAEGCFFNLYEVTAGGHRPEVYLTPSGIEDQVARSGGPTTYSYDLRVEDVDESGEPNAEPDSGLLQIGRASCRER